MRHTIIKAKRINVKKINEQKFEKILSKLGFYDKNKSNKELKEEKELANMFYQVGYFNK